MSLIPLLLQKKRLLGSNVNPFVPPDDLDISGMGYTSSQIDAYLIYHAFTLLTSDSDMDIRGNSNPTSASTAARQELYDNNNFIIYNEGYTP